MKIRTDFVTNSSSSSFILARKGEFTQKQKDAIIEFVEERLLGDTILLTPQSSEEEIQQVIDDNVSDRFEKEIRQALKEGKNIYEGYVTFEEAEYNIADLYQNLWEKLEKVDNKNFTAIDDSLDY